MSQHQAQTTARMGRWSSTVAALILVLLVGCEEDQITRYDAPKAPPLPAWANEDVPRLRMLTAIIPHDGQVWFFKLLGTDAAVTGLAEPFEQFVRSIRFTDDAKKPVEWKLPKDWQEQPASGSRMATIRMQANGQPAELTVTPLGPEAGNVLANVHRWRQQMGYRGPALTPDQLDRFAFEHNMPGGKVTVVDLVSVPLNLAAGEMPPARPNEDAPAKPSQQAGGDLPQISYKLPEGWQRSERPARMALVTLSTGPEINSAEVTVSPMPGAAGGVMANVNRWRGQVGLEPMELKDVGKIARKLQIDGNAALFFRFTGTGAAGEEKEKPKSILAIILPRQGVSWFIKLTGSAEVATAQEPSFVNFAESIRFKKEDSAGGAHP
ncbi:MAG: hypothetical protein K8T91_12610 [Planctomycetes bacterium]|nr:hypothetical protein [Planctomycetota bacterium]